MLDENVKENRPGTGSEWRLFDAKEAAEEVRAVNELYKLSLVLWIQSVKIS